MFTNHHLVDVLTAGSSMTTACIYLFDGPGKSNYMQCILVSEENEQSPYISCCFC